MLHNIVLVSFPRTMNVMFHRYHFQPNQFDHHIHRDVFQYSMNSSKLPHINCHVISLLYICRQKTDIVTEDDLLALPPSYRIPNRQPHHQHQVHVLETLFLQISNSKTAPSLTSVDVYMHTNNFTFTDSAFRLTDAEVGNI